MNLLTITKNIKGKKNVFLLGDFSVDLLKYDSLSSSMLLPYILHSTRVTGHSKP